LDKYITAKKYLEQISAVNLRLRSLAGQRRSLEDALYNISPKLSHTPRPPTADVHRMSGLVAAKLDIENEMEAASEKLAEVHKTINRIPDICCQAVLVARYVEGKRWGDIANEVGFSLSRVYDFHRFGLEHIECLLAG